MAFKKGTKDIFIKSLFLSRNSGGDSSDAAKNIYSTTQKRKVLSFPPSLKRFYFKEKAEDLKGFSAKFSILQILQKSFLLKM